MNRVGVELGRGTAEAKTKHSEGSDLLVENLSVSEWAHRALRRHRHPIVKGTDAVLAS